MSPVSSHVAGGAWKTPSDCWVRLTATSESGRYGMPCPDLGDCSDISAVAAWERISQVAQGRDRRKEFVELTSRKSCLRVSLRPNADSCSRACSVTYMRSRPRAMLRSIASRVQTSSGLAKNHSDARVLFILDAFLASM